MLVISSAKSFLICFQQKQTCALCGYFQSSFTYLVFPLSNTISVWPSLKRERERFKKAQQLKDNDPSPRAQQFLHHKSFNTTLWSYLPKHAVGNFLNKVLSFKVKFQDSVAWKTVSATFTRRVL
jgi:hypothetical protein